MLWHGACMVMLLGALLVRSLSVTSFLLTRLTIVSLTLTNTSSEAERVPPEGGIRVSSPEVRST